MYVPAGNRIDDPATVLAFMREHPFALLVSVVDGEPFATPLPVTVRDGEDGLVVRGHLARTNPQAGALDGASALVVFDGPHGYVSPRHYDASQSVPTWNYVTVHATGVAHTLAPQDVPAHEALLAELIGEHEPEYQQRWDAMPERYRSGMVRGIVPFEVMVKRLEGKAKLSQNKRAEERRRVAAALQRSGDAAARETGAWMATVETLAPQQTGASPDDAAGGTRAGLGYPAHPTPDD